jgi:hypothetical protein
MVLAGLPVDAATLKGVVIAKEMGGSGMDNVPVSVDEAGANSTVSKDGGQFVFEFPEKKAGEVEIESYLRKLCNEASTLPLGERKREVLDPASDEHYKSRSVYGDRIMWFNEQVSEVKRRFDPFLQVRE